MKIQLDMYQTLAVAVLVLLLGNFLKKRINFLEKFCIPSPVIGGLLFAIMTCICYTTGIAEFSFDDTLREVCMVFFFTSVNDIPDPDIAISMGCNVGCPFIGRPFDDNWGIEDPTGKSDEKFKIVIEQIRNDILELRSKLDKE